MVMKYRFGTFFLCVLLIRELIAANQLANFNNSRDRAAFYETLQALALKTLPVQISELGKFVYSFPEFERGYVWLLDRYRLNQQLGQAKIFFAGLANQKSSQRNSCWMLGKIHWLENDHQEALQAFTCALRSGPASPALLTDFLLFYKESFGDFNDPHYLESIELESIELSDENKAIAIALHSYLQLDFRLAIQQFRLLPKNLLPSLELLYCQGNSHFYLSQHQQADSLWQIGLAISREQKDLQFEAQFLMTLGVLYNNSETTERALSFFDSSYAKASLIGDLKNLEYLAGNRAYIYTQRGEFERAESLFREAIDISFKLKLDRELAIWYSEYGRLFHYLDRFDEAMTCYDRSAEFAKNSKNDLIIIQTLLNKGDLYRSIGQNELARLSYHEANNMAKNKNLDNLVMIAQEGEAELCIQEGTYAEARKIFKQYATSTKIEGYFSRRAYWFLKIGQSYLAEKSFELAKCNFQQAYNYAEKAKSDYILVRALVGVAETDFLLGNLDEATQSYNTCLEIANAKLDSSTLPVIYFGLGNIHKKSGDLNQAISNYGQAIAINEIIRSNLKNPEFRIDYFVKASSVYNEIIDCYYQKSMKNSNRMYLDSLYFYVEMSRARTLKEQKQFDLSKNVDDYRFSVYKQVCNLLKLKQRHLREEAWNTISATDWNKKVSEIEMARFSLLSQRLRLFENKKLTSDPNKNFLTSLSDVVKDLEKRNLSLLVYHISEEFSFVLAVSGNGVKLIPLSVEVSRLNAAVHLLISPFHHLDENTVESVPFKAETAYQLYRTLFKPVEDSLSLRKNLLIEPDIEIMNLPFELLLVEAPQKSEYTPWDEPTYAEHFLQHRYAIVYIPTTALLKKTSKWTFSKPSVLIFANPFDREQNNGLTSWSTSRMTHIEKSNLRQSRFRTGWRLEPLPFAELEAEKITQAVHSSKVYKQAKASKSAFLCEANKYEIIHFATHGFVDSTYDAFSGSS